MGKFGLPLVLTFVASLVLFATPALAATFVVDEDGFAVLGNCDALTPTYSSINAAIADASSGDTIVVCPGLYAEMVNINKDNLTLLGAQAGVDARTRPFNPLTESIIDHQCGPVQITADDAVLDGFTVQGSNLDPFIFFACFGAGIWMNPGFGADGGHDILNNIVQDNISGIELDSTCAANPTSVRFNLIQNNSLTGAGSGNAIQTNFVLCNATIDSNKFSGHTNASVLIPAGVGATNLTIANNELVGGSPGARFVMAQVSTGTIVGNVSIGSAALNGTIRLFGGNTNITINGNTLLNGVRGIRVDNPFAIGPNSGVVANQNCIQGNTLAGLQLDPGGHPGVLNAQSNWWGHPSGPMHPTNPTGMGDRVIDSPPTDVVDFTPWLTTPTASPCPALPPPPPSPNGPKDLVAGTGTITGFGDPMVHVNASRNKTTLEARGYFFIKYKSSNFEVSGRVTCLTVTGNKAGVGGVIERVKGTPPAIFGPTAPGNEVLITVLDMGSPGNLDQVNEGQLLGASSVCPETGNTFPIQQGNYVVKDDPPPSMLAILDVMLAEFVTAAECSSSLVCSGTGVFVLP